MFGTKFMTVAGVVAGNVLSTQPVDAQPPLMPLSVTISAADKQTVVNAAIREMNAHYVFEDIAKKVELMLVEKQKADGYAAITDSDKFAEKLTEDVQAVTRDKHIRVRFSASPIPERAASDKPTPEELAAEKLDDSLANFGVERVERLPLNIGYLDLRMFSQLEWAGDTVSSAMTLIANTDALIVDLRKNNGGDPETVALMTSYLVDERTHLNSFFYRDSNKTEQFWTHVWVPGKKFGGKKPIYVLTAKRTFSGAEEFSYNLKALKRGTIVGEATGGGAHPGESNRLSAHFTMFVPNGRAINPITKTNWEGTGVEPDVKVAADDALRTAQLLAAKRLLVTEKDANRLRAIADRIVVLEKEAPTKP